MIRRIARGLLLLGVLVAVILAVAFPTDDIARWVVARVTPPGTTTLTFRRARLRPSGLRLDDAALRRPDGSAVIEATWVRIRPSWLSLLGERRGRPWTLDAALCTGTLDVELDTEGRDQLVHATWKHLDIGPCLTSFMPQLELSGFGTGEASLRLPRSDPASGSGVIDLSQATWDVQEPRLGSLRLRADQATLRWALSPERFTVKHFSLAGPDVEIEIDGDVRLSRTSIGSGRLDLEAAIVLVPGATPSFGRLLSPFPPDADGTRHLHVTGTLDAPQIAPG